MSVESAPMLSVCLPILFAPVLQSGALIVSVDAREARFGMVHIKETIPVRPGKFTLSFPKWQPGGHRPGSIDGMVNLVFRAGSQTLTWRRDDVEMFHFVVDVPDNVTSIDAEFDDHAQPGTSFTPSIARLGWQRCVLYPTGQKSDDVQVSAKVTLPMGWRMATALIKGPSTTDQVEFPTVSLTEFIDSPALIGKNFNRVVLSPIEEIDIAGDNPASIEMSDEAQNKCKQLVAEANALFGAKHYRKYDFLLSLSNVGAFAGLEHHECSEDGGGADALTSPTGLFGLGDLLSHEYTHSWNGKYRRPAGLATPDYDSPMKGELLWVYEGLTQYLGKVLAARSGLATPDQFREGLARTTANLEYQAGRNWRSVEDTAISSQILRNTAPIWGTERRGQDYYEEAVPIWLEVDSVIRKQTNGQKSLDDFCKLFHGGQGGVPEIKPYTFEDIVSTLNTVCAYDWASLLKLRIRAVQPLLTEVGIQNDGWKLVWSDLPSALPRGARRGVTAPADNDAFFTLGARIGADGAVGDMILTLPAGAAGIRPGMKIVGINGLTFSNENLLMVLGNKAEFDLVADYGGELKTFHIAYKDGLRYPHLQRDESRPDVLSDVIKSAVH